MCMKWSSPVKRFLVAVFASLLFVSGARADTLTLNDSLAYGKVISVSPSQVTFAPACTGRQIIDKATVKRITFDASCMPHPVQPYSAGGGLCEKASNVFVLRFSDPVLAVYAADYSVAGDKVHWTAADGTTMSHAPMTHLASVTRERVCSDVLEKKVDLPAIFCSEARPWAVNFSYAPVLDNRILTRGLSFYLEDENGKPFDDTIGLGQTIRAAFGTALTEWMAALQDHRAELSPQVQTAIDGMISRGSRVMLLTPPQVVQLGCRDSASFVIRFATTDESQLRNPDGSDRKAARAEVAGRTVLINGVAYKCWKADARAVLFLEATAQGPACFNLVPILVHELGHAFGLKGHIDGAQRSIMDSQISPDLLRPTAADALALANILGQPIEGVAAGRLDADGAGVTIAARAP
jgi:hypothetical protein